MAKNLIFMQKLLGCLQNVQLSATDCNTEQIQRFINESTDGALDFLMQHSDDFWSRLPQLPAREDTIYECVSISGITFFVHKARNDKRLYFIGPLLTKPLSDADNRRILLQQHVPKAAIPLILELCSRLPVIPGHTAYRMADLVIQHLTGSDIPLKISQQNTLSDYEGKHSILPEFPEKEIVHMRQTERRYEYSISLTEAVKQGNLSLALHLMGNYTPEADNPMRNPNPLRNAQNYCIVMNTQLRHALEDSGIHPTRIDALSNEIGFQIERLTSLSQIPEFTTRVIRQYCQLVQEHSYPGLRPVTHLAVSYIKDHLSENLTVRDTASVLSVNANYLSSLFHADLGITFIDFVNQERVKQAAALLQHTSLQIQQVAALVGYNNTSYFARQFKRTFGTTPQAYRANLS